MLRAYDGEVESKARSPVGFLLVAKDLTALGAACERQGSWTHCGTGGFHWRIPTLRYKTKPAEEGQPHPSFCSWEGWWLPVCDLSAFVTAQAAAYSFLSRVGTRQCKRGLAPLGDVVDEAGRGQLAEMPAWSE